MDKIDWINVETIDILNPDVVAAKGSMIKYLLGINDNSPITAEQLIYLKENFVRLTGVDNYLQSFFNSITDFDKAAKWISKYSCQTGEQNTLLGFKTILGKGL